MQPVASNAGTPVLGAREKAACSNVLLAARVHRQFTHCGGGMDKPRGSMLVSCGACMSRAPQPLEGVRDGTDMSGMGSRGTGMLVEDSCSSCCWGSGFGCAAPFFLDFLGGAMPSPFSACPLPCECKGQRCRQTKKSQMCFPCTYSRRIAWKTRSFNTSVMMCVCVPPFSWTPAADRLCPQCTRRGACRASACFHTWGSASAPCRVLAPCLHAQGHRVWVRTCRDTAGDACVQHLQGLTLEARCMQGAVIAPGERAGGKKLTLSNNGRTSPDDCAVCNKRPRTAASDIGGGAVVDLKTPQLCEGPGAAWCRERPASDGYTSSDAGKVRQQMAEALCAPAPEQASSPKRVKESGSLVLLH
eukprot:414513-Pelagomonas_calceolata.AAC.2